MESSYWTTVLYLKEFEQIKMLPPQLRRRCTIYKNGEDLAEVFIENHVVFHKSCVSVYDKQKLNRKLKHAESFNVFDAPENPSESDPIEVRINYSSTDLRNFIPNCLFCGEGDCEKKLHRCQAFAVK